MRYFSDFLVIPTFGIQPPDRKSLKIIEAGVETLTPTCTPTAEFTYDKQPYLPALGLRHLGSARQWKSDANK